jgi:hypothetical protein
MHPKDLLFMYCKIQRIKQIGVTLKKDILKEISLFMRTSANKEVIDKTFSSLSAKINYNNILFFEEIGFTLQFDIDDKNNILLTLKNAMTMPPFVIKKQTYFHYKLFTRLLQMTKDKPVLKKYFDSLGFFNEDLIKTDYIFEPYFKMSNKIFLNEKDYIIIEYFEKNNLDKYAGIFSEKLRIGNILTFSKEEKCKKFYVFWENNINDLTYFDNFINNIVNFIEDYEETVDTYFYKNNKIDIRKLDNKFIKMLLEDNEKISIKELNKHINWKKSTSEEEMYTLFRIALYELNKDHQEGFLNRDEFNFYIQKLSLNFVINEEELKYWSNLNNTIQIEYRKCILEFMNCKIKQTNDMVFGLEDY